MLLPLKILFICTHNRCRSILCEAISNQLGGDKLLARSAGSQPSGVVHPHSLRFLAAEGINTDELRSESWDAHQDFNPDLIITVCDSAANEECPLRLGNAIKLHWGLQDPSNFQGSEEEVARAFSHCISEIQSRTKALLALDIGKLDSLALARSLRELGAK
jgi:arsenate reductase